MSSTAFFIAALINFALFAAILVRLARRPVVSLFAEREKTARETMDRYRDAYERAEREIARFRRLLEDLPEERRRVTERYGERAAQAAAEIAERARRETDFLRREAHRVAREVRDRCYEESFESLVAALVADAEQGAGALDAERRRAVLTASADLLERGDAR
ncbi:MAG TPA: hypothetical protein P5077_09885 [bacterium]|nr:hypothetical protein [bacterium]